MGKKHAYAFDFDGTLTTSDTLLEIIRYHVGGLRMLWGFVKYSPWLVLMKLKLYSNYRAKERIFSHFFGGMTLADFNTLCRHFANDNELLLRPDMKSLVRQVAADGAPVFIVSASIDNWVKPFTIYLDENIKVVGTQIEVNEGILTGRFLTPNCYGQEKVERLKAAFTDRDNYYLTAYGDSRGDKELLQFADKGINIKHREI
jgi:phosphatidylglycerophosphatase C